LTCRANHRYIVTIARIEKPATGKPAADFLFYGRVDNSFALSQILNYDCQKKDLTCRANHLYIVIIARIKKPAAGKPAAGFSLAGARERAGTRRGLMSTFARGPSMPIWDHTGATIYCDRAGNDDLPIAREG
jgi:hypothetical protein